MEARTCVHRLSITSSSRRCFSSDLQTNHPKSHNCTDISGRRDHCLAEAGTGHLLRTTRSAITSRSPARRCPQRLPSQPALHVPTPMPPWLQKGQKDTRKRAQSPARVPPRNQRARKPKARTKTGPWSAKSPRLAPTLLCSSLRPFFLPVSTTSWYTLPFQHPAAVITPLGSNPLFLMNQRKAPESPL